VPTIPDDTRNLLRIPEYFLLVPMVEYLFVESQVNSLSSNILQSKKAELLYSYIKETIYRLSDTSKH
jgi:hypothetical protein